MCDNMPQPSLPPSLSPPPSLPPSLPDGGDYGLGEKDMAASVATVTSLCEQIEADLIFLRERAEAGGKIRDYLIRRRVDELDFLEVRYVDVDLDQRRAVGRTDVTVVVVGVVC